MSKRAIGIDLGTTYSRVGVWQNDHVEVIPNDQGHTATPSYVAFTNTNCFIGDAAKTQVVLNTRNTIYNAKRLVGRKFSDADVQSDIEGYPFTVLDRDSEPHIRVKHRGETKEFSPEQVMSMLLAKMKTVAESYLGEEVTAAVVTVPACFNISQRQAMRQAGTAAGLDILRIVSEPTAAAIAYNLDKRANPDPRTILVVDLGGGSVNTALLVTEDLVSEVRAAAGNSHLGGEDFDDRLVAHFSEEFKTKTGKDLGGNHRALRRLRTACEQAKRTLSRATQTTIAIDSLCDGVDFSTSVTRACFEELCEDLFRATLEPVEVVLRRAGIDKSQVDEIVLAGGSSRIPRIRQLLSDFFDGKEPKMMARPDQAAVCGATIHATVLTGKLQDTTRLLLDVTPSSLGIETMGGTMALLVKRDTLLPTLKRKLFTTHSDNQRGAFIQVFEGEHARTEDNVLLGRFVLSGIPPAPRGVPVIEVGFNIDASCNIIVSATERTTGASCQIALEGSQRGLSEEEMDRMTAEAEEYWDAAEGVRFAASVNGAPRGSSVPLGEEELRTWGVLECPEGSDA